MNNLNKFFVKAILEAAKESFPLTAKIEKLNEQINSLTAKYNEALAKKTAIESSIKQITNGYALEQLVKAVVVTSADENGKESKKTTYALLYPETLFPPQEIATEPKNEETQEINPNPFNN